MSRPKVLLVQRGLLKYADAMTLQQELMEQVLQRPCDGALLLLEHQPVITTGRGTRPGHLLADAATLERLGVEVHESSRGGDITYHGPGQLVAYPILNLALWQQDLHWYLRTLEEVAICTAAAFGVDCVRIAGRTGVWTAADPPRKIAAIGVRVQRWITSHGLSLNVRPDLSHFGLIVPCGLHDASVTSLEQILGVAPADELVRDEICRSFQKLFGCSFASGDAARGAG